MNCITCRHPKAQHSDVAGCLSCRRMSGAVSVPVAHVSRDIAEAFGMEGLPNVVIEERAPGVVALEFGLAREVLATTEPKQGDL